MPCVDQALRQQLTRACLWCPLPILIVWLSSDDPETGVSIIELSKDKFDVGQILAQQRMPGMNLF